MADVNSPGSAVDAAMRLVGEVLADGDERTTRRGKHRSIELILDLAVDVAEELNVAHRRLLPKVGGNVRRYTLPEMVGALKLGPHFRRAVRTHTTDHSRPHCRARVKQGLPR